MSNGHLLPRSVDSRSQWARRFRDLLALHLADMAGTESIAESQILRRACLLITALEKMEEKIALRGYAEIAELEVYQRCSNTMKRLLESVGLQRRSRDVSPPTLAEYVRNRHEASEVEAE
jgi:hypothetical protein